MAETQTHYGIYSGLRSKRDYLLRLHAGLVLDRTSFDAHWREIADFLVPRRLRTSASDVNRGDRRNQNIIDSTGTFAARTLGSGLHAGLTSPSRPWFKLGLADQDLAKFKPVKEWLHEVGTRMSVVFNGCNLYNALPVLYEDMGLFSTGAMSLMPDAKDLLRAYNYAAGSYNVGVDNRGLASTFTREYELTVRQVVGEFGGEFGQPLTPGQPINWSNIAPAVKTHWERAEYDVRVRVLWVVAPNPDHRPERLASKYYPWLSCHVDIGGATRGDNDERLLRESGFKYFPLFVPRWSVTSAEDAYGTNGPGMTALGDVKQLQIQQRDKGRAIQKMIAPPVQAPTALMNAPLNLNPNGVTHVDVRDQMGGVRSIYDVKIDLSHLTLDMADVKQRIQRAFYEDLFLMLQTADMMSGDRDRTAREIQERHEEKLQALGPMLERTNDELLNPMIDYAYERMDDAGMIPEPPEELEGLRIVPEYISSMAQAQRLVDVGRTDRFLQTTLNIAAVDPRVLHKIDLFHVVDQYAELYGVDPRMVRSSDEALELVAQAERQQQAIAAAQVAKDSAQAGKLASETRLDNGDTALSRLIQQGV